MRRPPVQRWWATYVLIGAAMVVALLAALQAVADLLRPAREILLVVVFAVVVAFLLGPLVRRLERVMPRALAIAATLLGALAVTFGTLALLAAPLIRQSRGLVDRLPGYVDRVQSGPVSIGGVEIPDDVRQRVLGILSQQGEALVQNSAGIVVGTFGAVIDILLVLVVAAYLLAAGPGIRAFALALLPPRRRPMAARVEEEVATIFGRYARGQLLLALIIGVLNLVAFTILGLPYALLLGVIAGILELVPIVGPIVAGTLAAIVALLQPEPFPLVLWVIVAAVLIQQLENNLLVPRISGGAVDLHPLAALLAVTIALQFFGIVGGLFAVPVAGLAALYLRRWVASRDARAAASATPPGT